VPELAVLNALDYILEPVAICTPGIPMFTSSILKAKERSGVVPISKIEFLLCVYFRPAHNESVGVGRCFNYTLQRLLAQLEVVDVVFFGCALEGRSQGGQVVVCLYQVGAFQLRQRSWREEGTQWARKALKEASFWGRVSIVSLFISGILIFSELIDFTKS
jgi:hypothetical protein